MTYPFQIVVQHHQGDGVPNDNFAYAGGGYSYGIGVNRWQRFRDPAQDFSTADWNHKVVGVCLSGNREIYPVTQNDLQMMREIAFDAKSNGWLIEYPTVKPHREMGGDNKTICPGKNAAPPWQQYPGNTVMWDQMVAAYRGVSNPGEDDVPADKDFVDALASKDGIWKLQYDGGVQTVSGTFYGSYFSLPANVRNDPTRRFLSMFANTDRGYSLVSTKGEVYAFNKPA